MTNPKTVLISNLNKIIDKPIDIFICSGSFESRSLEVARAIGPKNVKKAIVAYNENLKTFVEENYLKLTEIFGDKTCKARLDTGDPLKTADAFITELNKVTSSGKQKHYLIDITTFTHEAILILIKLLSMKAKTTDKITCVYVGAKEYSYKNKKKDKWLSKGLADIRSVLGYPGIMDLSRPTHLIVLVGFEHERATSLINELDPEIISLGYGKSGTETDKSHKDANLHFHGLLSRIASTHCKVNNFEFSCTDPVDTKNMLITQINNCPDHNVIIAPMNTKISTIGVALATMEIQDIQLCYAQPRHYNYYHYSIPGKNCYLFDIDLFSKPNSSMIRGLLTRTGLPKEGNEREPASSNG